MHSFEVHSNESAYRKVDVLSWTKSIPYLASLAPSSSPSSPGFPLRERTWKTSPRTPQLKRMMAHWILARGVCFLPFELVVGLYDLREHPTIAEVVPQIFACAFALSINNPLYGNILDWVQATFTKVVWKSHTTLYLDGPIRISWSWVVLDFQGDSLEGLQASEFIRGRFPGRYGVPLTGDTSIARAPTTLEAAANADQDGVQSHVLWGEEPEAHLDNGFLTAQDLPVPSPFRPGYEAYAMVSDLGCGGSPAPDSNCGQGAWGSPPQEPPTEIILVGPVTPLGGNHHRKEWARGTPNANVRSGFFQKEEVEAVELEAPVAEEDPSKGVTAAAATVLAWWLGAALLWTSPQSFDLKSRHQ